MSRIRPASKPRRDRYTSYMPFGEAGLLDKPFPRDAAPWPVCGHAILRALVVGKGQWPLNRFQLDGLFAAAWDGQLRIVDGLYTDENLAQLSQFGRSVMHDALRIPRGPAFDWPCHVAEQAGKAALVYFHMRWKKKLSSQEYNRRYMAAGVRAHDGRWFIEPREDFVL